MRKSRSVKSQSDTITTKNLTARQKANQEISDGARLAAVQLIIHGMASGGNINTKDNQFGLTPLTMSAIKGDFKIAQFLLICGANPNTKGKDGKTALYYANRFGRSDIAAIIRQYELKAMIRNG